MCKCYCINQKYNSYANGQHEVLAQFFHWFCFYDSWKSVVISYWHGGTNIKGLLSLPKGVSQEDRSISQEEGMHQ